MDYRLLNATIQYEENCDYNSSIKYQDISFSLQDVNLTINVTSCTDYSDCDEDILKSLSYNIPLLLNEKLQITTIVTCGNLTVTAGKVIFYYRYNDDTMGEWNQINENPIEIDNHGEASIIFMPHGSGKIKVEYIGDEYYADKTLDNFPLELDTIPTKITFIPPDDDYPPHFVNPEDTITMSVYVNDIKKNPVKHGLVTFLHYFTHNIDDPYGIEKVIGNPVYLENGIGTITYSPMQVESIKQYIESGVGKYQNIFKNIELIRAVYNYNKTEYGVNWHYYKSHSDYTTISILRPNTLSISIEKIINQNLTPLNVELGGTYNIQDNESFILSATITNNENEEISTEDDYITFVINENEYIGTYNENTERFEYIVTNLPIGNYEIYAYIANKQKFFTQEDIVINDNGDEIATDNHGNILENAKYLQSLESDYIYLEVVPATTHCELTLTATPPFYIIDNNKSYDKSKLKVTFNMAGEDKPLLHDETCYFNVLQTNQTYTGIIKYENGEVFAYPTNNIPMEEVNNYTIRAYIPNKTYKYYNGIKEISKNLPTIFSNDVTIRARKQMSISFGDQKTLNNYYPGSIKFFVKGENLYTDILNVRVFLDNNLEYDEYQLTNNNSIIQCYIDNIEVGEHTIHAEVINNDFNIQPATPYTFTVGKNYLTSELYTTSTYAAIEQTITFGIKSINDNTINNINENKLNITLLDPNNTEVECTYVQNNELTSDSLLYYILTAPLHQVGKWTILIGYTEDDHYIMSTETFEFNVVNTDPIFNLFFDKENTLQGQITHDGSYNNNQIINLLLQFNYNNANPKTLNVITNEYGYFSVSPNNNIFNNNNEWNEWSSIQITFNLTNNQNQNIIGYNNYEKTVTRQEIGVKYGFTELNEQESQD